MAELLFYSEPTLLNREVHKTLRFSASPDYSFVTIQPPQNRLDFSEFCAIFY